MDESLVGTLAETMERLCVAVAQLEGAVGRLDEQRTAIAASTEESVGRIVATVETAREAELERKLAAAEARVEELTAAGVAAAQVSALGRKTLPSGPMALLSKQGVALEAGATMDAAGLDAALSSLSIEQRIAVKGELMRAGLLR